MKRSWRAAVHADDTSVTALCSQPAGVKECEAFPRTCCGNMLSGLESYGEKATLAGEGSRCAPGMVQRAPHR